MTTTYAADRQSRFIKCLEYLEGMIEDESKRIENPGATVDEIVHSYGLCLEFYERLDSVRKGLYHVYNRYKESILPTQILEIHGQTNAQSADFIKVNISMRANARIREGMKDPAYAWLRQYKLGDIITETVNAQTLSKVYGEAIESKSSDVPKDWPVDLFNLSTGFTTRTSKLSNFIKPREENNHGENDY